MSICILCNEPISPGGYEKNRNPRGRAREHCIPMWLQEFLGIEKLEYTRTLLGVSGGVRPLVVSGSVAPPLVELREAFSRRMLTEKLNDTCGSCNHGWMLELENQARPVLQSMIRGETMVEFLSPAEREALTRWMIKTAYSVNAVQSLHRLPVEHVREVMAGAAVPPGIYLLAGRQPGHEGVSPYQFIISGVAPMHWGDLPSFELARDAFYKVTFRFESLLLTLAYALPGAGWLAVLSRVHERRNLIWPPDPTVVEVQSRLPLPSVAAWTRMFHVSVGMSQYPFWINKPAASLLRVGDASPFEVFEHDLGIARGVEEQEYGHHKASARARRKK